MDSKGFFLEGNNLFLDVAYENDNFKIINGIRGDTCIVFVVVMACISQMS